MSNIRSGSKVAFLEAQGNGTDKIIIQAPSSLDADYTFTFPGTMGTSGYFLKTNGSTLTSWANPNTIIFRTVINSGTYTILTTDHIVAVTYTSTGAVTLTLPPATNSIRILIVDEGGNAGTNNITVNPDGSDTIIGESSVIINGDHNSLSLYSNGSNQWFIG